MSCYIIAEAGVNHNGDIAMALKLCKAAKEAGVNAIKFQIFKTEEIIVKNTPKADYQQTNTSNKQSQFDMIKKLELSFEDFIKIKQYCDDIDIQFLSTPDDSISLDFLCSLGVPLIKIGSGEVTNIPFLRKIGRKRLPVILSTGMSTLGEIENAITELTNSGADDISLLHCTTNYPCPFNEVNLNAMKTIRDAFKFPVGYSDHTTGITIPIAAVTLGAKILEKHFTLDKSLHGPDHKASLNPEELKEMVLQIRNTEESMGDGVKKPNKSEVIIKKYIQRSIVASKKIQIGDKFSELNLTVKRTGMIGISSTRWDYIIGKIAKKRYNPDDIIYD